MLFMLGFNALPLGFRVFTLDLIVPTFQFLGIPSLVLLLFGDYLFLGLF